FKNRHFSRHFPPRIGPRSPFRRFSTWTGGWRIATLQWAVDFGLKLPLGSPRTIVGGWAVPPDSLVTRPRFPQKPAFFPSGEGWGVAVPDIPRTFEPTGTMSRSPETASSPTEPTVDLKNPMLAAGLALLVPGLGHAYQGRNFKAAIFFVCILGLFFTGQ